MTSSEPARARVVIVQDGHVALIERDRDGKRYYVFPGGGVEPGESPAEAAVREAHEELGVEVRLLEQLHDELLDATRFVYFLAEIVGGRFGTGEWPDHADRDAIERERRGTYQPVWLPLDDLGSVDVRPAELADVLRR